MSTSSTHQSSPDRAAFSSDAPSIVGGMGEQSRRPRLVRHVHAEWIKLRSLRSSRWLLVAAAAAVPAIGVALTAALLIDEDGSTRPQVFFDATFIGAQLSSLLLGALGASSIAGEFSSRTADALNRGSRV